MGTKKKTGYGTINISKSIYYEIIRNAVKSTGGKCRLGNMRFLLPFLINDESNCMNLRIEGEDLSVELFVIVRFGNSLSRITDAVIEYIKEECINCTGTAPVSVKVTVTGLEVAGKVVRRNVEYTRER